ncbi:hypothetical protein ACFO6P_28010, partial [Cupriavidus campinensis]
RRIACVSFVMILAALGGCAAVQSDRSVLAAARSANYTEDYIYDYWIQTVSGKDTGVGGIQVKEFSRGGTSGSICCSRMPGVGQTIKVGMASGRTSGRQVHVENLQPGCRRERDDAEAGLQAAELSSGPILPQS